jgi:hypothetical protein
MNTNEIIPEYDEYFSKDITSVLDFLKERRGLDIKVPFFYSKKISVKEYI